MTVERALRNFLRSQRLLSQEKKKAVKKLKGIKPKKRALRPGRREGEDLWRLRLDCFERDNFTCRKCGQKIAWDQEESILWGQPRGEMAHIKSRGAGGKDELSNVRTLCPEHHRLEHNGGKPVPKKEKP